MKARNGQHLGEPDVMGFQDFVRERERERPGFRALLDSAVRRQKLLLALAEHRRSSGMSQPEVARQMRTSQSAIARLEAGDGNPRMSTIERYAAAIGMHVEWQLIDESNGAKIKDIMSPEPPALNGDVSLANAAPAIAREGGVIVIDPLNGRTAGVVTAREVVIAVATGANPATTPLSSICVDRIVRAEDSQARVRDLMLINSWFDRVGVLDESDRPIGLISIADMEKEAVGA